MRTLRFSYTSSIAVALAGALTAVSVLVGWRRPNRAKQQPYECGVDPTGDARQPFSVKFYLVAMVFHFVRCGSDLLVPLGLHLPRHVQDFTQLWSLRLRGDAHLHRHPLGRIHLSVEKRRVRLAYIVERKAGFQNL